MVCIGHSDILLLDCVLNLSDKTAIREKLEKDDKIKTQGVNGQNVFTDNGTEACKRSVMIACDLSAVAVCCFRVRWRRRWFAMKTIPAFFTFPELKGFG